MGQSNNLLGLGIALATSVALNLSAWLAPSPLAALLPVAAEQPCQSAALRRSGNSVSRLEQTVEDQCSCGDSPDSRVPGVKLTVALKLGFGGWLTGLLTALGWSLGLFGRCVRSFVTLAPVPPLTPAATVSSNAQVGVPVKHRRGTVLA